MTTPIISILSVGNELLDGRVVDTNSSWIGYELRRRGLSLTKITTCCDTIDATVESLKFLLSEADVVIVSGGLGPTADDLTRDSVAQLLGVELKLHQPSLDKLEKWLIGRGRALTETNRRQAYIPAGSELIENPVGSAPGFIATYQEKLICTLPGVPSELKHLFLNSVMPRIQQSFLQKDSAKEVGFRVFGLPEAEVGLRIESCKLPAEITVCYRVIFPEIEVLFRGESSLVDSALSSAQSVLGSHLVSTDPDLALEALIVKQLTEKGDSLAVAESCTGGMLGEILTSVPGASQVFLGGFLTYQNELKANLLGVPSTLIEKHGAVSEEVACAMAEGARKKTSATYALSITGVAGPDGGTTDKPVGLFWTALAHPGGVKAIRTNFPSSRDRIRRYACYVALDMLRKF